jgi:Uncharacterised protein family (UPF0158)
VWVYVQAGIEYADLGDHDTALAWLGIHPLPSYVWYEDMADFAEQISDEQAGRRLARAIRGRGAFRHFKNELHEEYLHLVPVWYAFRDTRHRPPRTAVAMTHAEAAPHSSTL